MRRPLAVVAVLLAHPLFAADPPAKPAPPAPADDLAAVTVAGGLRGGGSTSISLKLGGKSFRQHIYFFIMAVTPKQYVIGVADLTDRPGEKKGERGDKLEKVATDRDGKRFVAAGRLVLKGEKVNTGGMTLLDDEILTLGGSEKQVFLQTDTLAVVDPAKPGAAPPEGKVRVVGRAVCAMKDLKLTAEPTLAVSNGDLPIILSGEKAKGDPAKIGRITVVGALTVDDKGRLRLAADEVTAEKP